MPSSVSHGTREELEDKARAQQAKVEAAKAKACAAEQAKRRSAAAAAQQRKTHERPRAMSPPKAFLDAGLLNQSSGADTQSSAELQAQARVEAAKAQRDKVFAEMEAQAAKVAAKLQAKKETRVWEEQVKLEAEHAVNAKAEAERLAVEAKAEAERVAAERAAADARARAEAKVAEAARRKESEEAEARRWARLEEEVGKAAFRPSRKQPFLLFETTTSGGAVAESGATTTSDRQGDGSTQLSLHACREQYREAEARLNELRAASAPADKVTAARREVEKLKPMLRQLSAAQRVQQKNEDGGSAAGTVAARRLQRQRAREEARSRQEV